MDLFEYAREQNMDRESPPENTPFRCERSAFFMFGRRSRASYRVGTPAMKLHLYLVMSLE